MAKQQNAILVVTDSKGCPVCCFWGHLAVNRVNMAEAFDTVLQVNSDLLGDLAGVNRVANTFVEIWHLSPPYK